VITENGIRTRQGSRYRLTAIKVEKEKRPGKHPDANGLYLLISDTGARSWVFRFTSPAGEAMGRRREMGLGGVDTLSLV
jgi:hypothetical protein